MNGFDVGDRVYGRVGSDYESVSGEIRGASLRCPLGGCNGIRVIVRWPDGHMTRPCSRGLQEIGPGQYRIV